MSAAQGSAPACLPALAGPSLVLLASEVLVPRDLPSASRGVLPACVHLSVHVGLISPFRADAVSLD